jgi:EpsI family protein
MKPPQLPISEAGNRWCIPVVAVMLASFLLAYGGVIFSLYRKWTGYDMYSYGIFIPFIVSYLIYLKKNLLQTVLKVKNNLTGVPLLFLGLSMLVIGHAGSILVLKQISLPITIISMVIIIYGWQIFRIIRFPLLYLFFMIPFWELITISIHLPFQKISAYIGVGFLKFFGIPVFKENLFLYLPNITLQVAEACSGLNYLIAILAIGIPLSYLYIGKMSKRILLLSLATLIAFLGNGLRVSLVGLLAYYGFKGPLHGPYHVLQGVFVSFVGYLLLFAGLIYLKDQGPSTKNNKDIKINHPSLERKIQHRWTFANNPWAIIILVASLLASGVFVSFSEARPEYLKNSLSLLPLELGKWQGYDNENFYNPFSEHKPDETLMRTYFSNDYSINLYVGYYTSQDQGKEMIFHKTYYLNADTNFKNITTQSGHEIRINYGIISDKNSKYMIFFNYLMNGHEMTEVLETKFYTAWNRLSLNRNSGSIIMFTSKIVDPTNEEMIEEVMKNFIRQAYPVLKVLLS